MPEWLHLACGSGRARERSRPSHQVVPPGCTFWHCNGARVLPWSTFGAFVSEYFSNPMIWRPFGQPLAESPPNRVLKGLPTFLTNVFSIWRTYCQQETADCSDAQVNPRRAPYPQSAWSTPYKGSFNER